MPRSRDRISFKPSRDRFFEYHANSKEKYARLVKEYEQTCVLPDKIVAFEIKIVENEPPRHLIFEVDMEYSSTLHERDDVYPMAPELMAIMPETTSQKQHDLMAKYFTAAYPYSRKLICSFLPKKRYVVLGHMLCFYLDRRMKLIKVHRGIKFTANLYLAQYIDNNTNKQNQHKKEDVKKVSIS